MKCLTPLLLIAVAATGCAGAPPPEPVYINRDVTRVVVLPPFSEVMDPESWKTMWPYLLEQVSARGYAVVTEEQVQQFYAENRFHADPAEIRVYSPAEIAKEFQADAVFYSNITRWSYQYILLASTFGVEADFELVDGKTEERLWAGHGAAVHTEALRGDNEFALLASIFIVAGNAFLNSVAGYAEDCVALGLVDLPHAGYDPDFSSGIPGTKEGEPQSEEKVSGGSSEGKVESKDKAEP